MSSGTVRNADGSYSWSAYNPNQWGHYHHAGVQVNAYRIAPFRVRGVQRRTIWTVLLHCMFKLMGVR